MYAPEGRELHAARYDGLRSLREHSRLELMAALDGVAASMRAALYSFASDVADARRPLGMNAWRRCSRSQRRRGRWRRHRGSLAVRVGGKGSRRSL